MNYSTSPTSSQGSYFSTSPLLAQDPLVYKLRYDAGRGFDPDDDHEFCPQLTAQPAVQLQQSPKTPVQSYAYAPATPADLVSPVRRPAQPRKALEIINPATGLRVGSPKSRS